MRKSRVGSIPKKGTGKQEKGGNDQNQLHPKKKGWGREKGMKKSRASSILPEKKAGEGAGDKDGQSQLHPQKKSWG